MLKIHDGSKVYHINSSFFNYVSHSSTVSNNLMFSIVLWLLRAIISSMMTFKWSAQSATAKATIVRAPFPLAGLIQNSFPEQ